MGMTIPTIPSLPAGYVVTETDLANLSAAATFAINKPMTYVVDNLGGQAIGTTFSPVFFTNAFQDSDGLWGSFLTGQNTGFEGGDGTWTGAGDATIANSVAQAHSGAASLAITSVAAGSMQAAHVNAANIATGGMPVVSGQIVPVTAWFRAATTARSCNIGLDWYNSAGTLLSATRGASVTNSTTTWTFAAAVLTAPASAAFCRANAQVVSTAAASEVHYLDDVTLAPNADRLIIQTPGWYKISYGVNVGTVGGVFNTAVRSTTGANNPQGSGVNSNYYWAGYTDVSAGVVGYAGATGDWPFYMYQGDYFQVFVQAAAAGASTGITGINGAIGIPGSYLMVELVSI